MPRQRLSIDQAKMRGSLAVNAGRFEARKKAPKATGQIGKPPKYFKPRLAEIWSEISSAIPFGVAGSADRMVIEMASRLLDQFRTDPEMQASRIAILMQLLSRLGLDPQARTKLQVEMPKQQKPDDEWSFLN